MKLVLAVVTLAVLAGLFAGGSFRGLADLRVRHLWLAPVCLFLQMAPTPSSPTWAPLAMLYVSLGGLLFFCALNRRLAGFLAISAGLVLNLTVIAVNGGMPVSKGALVASGQADTLSLLEADGGAKHHLAGPGDRLMFLGDVIAIPAPIAQAVSAGDILVYGGVCWLLVAAMRRSRRRPVALIERAAGIGP
ncbi:MAG: DUF5317 domain-containing protein [Actinomycetota bacterium]